MFKEIKTIIHYVPKVKMALFVLSIIANSVLNLATALIVQSATDIQGKTNNHNIFLFGIVSMLLYAYVSFAYFFANYMEDSIIYSAITNMKQKLLKVLVLKKTKYSNSEKISIFTNDMQLFSDRYLMQLLDIPSYLLIFFIPLIYMVSQNRLMGLLFVIGSILLPIPQSLLNRKLNDLGKKLSEKRAQLLSAASDEINGRTTLINNENVDSALVLGNKKIKESKKALFYSNIFLFIALSLSMLLKGVIQVIPFAIGLFLIANGDGLSFSILLALYLTSQQMGQPIQQVLMSLTHVQEMKNIRKKIFDLLFIKIDLDSKPSLKENNTFDYLDISNLSKNFEDKTIFKDFNKKIYFGSRVLVTGESGSGKSTLLKMISQEIAMDYGDISIVKNGENLGIPVGYVGFVSQEPFIFNGSIKYNLTLGQDFNDRILTDTLKKVNLEEIDLEYMIQNNGENLSGGQKIRLELARVLLRNKSLILVDEVTASLDKKNSKKIRDLIYSLSGVTIIEVAHHIDDESRYDNIITIGKEG